jgi:hypothetical protein
MNVRRVLGLARLKREDLFLQRSNTSVAYIRENLKGRRN